MSHNNRLQLSQYQVEKSPQQGSTIVMKSDYEYYADARLRFADDGINVTFHRSYTYDHVARLFKAYSGAASPNFIDAGDGPYRQFYQHDAWGNLTGREGRYWSEPDTFTASYVSNRRQDPPPAPAWSYDASGNVLNDTDADYTYDAVGRNRSVTGDDGQRSTTQWHDGDGEAVVVERLRQQPFFLIVTYYVRSSVLGGRVVTELNASGQKVQGKIYLGGVVIGVQDGVNAGAVARHENPLTGSWGQSFPQGTFFNKAQADPMGVNVGFTDPFSEEVEYEPDLMLAKVVVNRGGLCGGCPRCFADSIELDCRIADMMLRSEAAVRCPDDDCGPRTVYNPHTRRQELSPLIQDPETGRLGHWRWQASNTTVRIGDEVSDNTPPEWHRIFDTGTFNFFAFGLALGFEPQNYSQDRSDLKIDRDVFKNKKPPKHPGLPDCVKNYLSKFFDPAMLDAITWGHGIPLYVPMDAAAFTLDDHIYFGEGAFSPLDGIQLDEIILIGHETTHVRQYRQNGSLRQKGKYLVDSAIKGVAGTILGGTGLGWTLSYYGNKFEKQAFEMEKKIKEDLAKNGNPCP